MGLEAKCILRVARDTFVGKAHLNTDRLEFRGETRVDIPFSCIKSAEVRLRGALEIRHTEGRLTLGLANRATAEKWALKIRHPKSLIDKLGLKPDSRVAVLGVNDADFLTQARQRLDMVPSSTPHARLDFIFHAADSSAELLRLKTLKRYLQPAGAIWVISLKGKAARIKDTDVMRAARAAGLVDIKVCGFSATHTALKLVVPKDAR